MSIQLSQLPPNCTKEFLDNLFINECFHIGIDMLPNGTAEMVLPNIHDAVDVLYPCFFVSGQEIITVPYFKLGLKMENTVFYNQQDSPSVVNLKLKKGIGIVKNIRSYILAAFRTRILEVTMDASDPNFDVFKVTLDDEGGSKDVSVVREMLGFKGQFYSIPYAKFDFQKGEKGNLRTELSNLFYPYCRKFEPVKAQDKLSCFDQSEYSASPIVNECCKSSNVCEYRKLIKSDFLNFSNFFSEKVNSCFFNHYSHLNQYRQPSEEDIDLKSSFSHNDDSLLQIFSLVRKQQGINIYQKTVINELMDKKPLFRQRTDLSFKGMTVSSNEQQQDAESEDFVLSKNQKKEFSSLNQIPDSLQQQQQLSKQLLEVIEKKKKNIVKVEQRLGQKIDFKDLPEQEVKKIKYELKKIKRKEKQKKLNDKRKEKKRLEKLKQEEEELK